MRENTIDRVSNNNEFCSWEQGLIFGNQYCSPLHLYSAVDPGFYKGEGVTLGSLKQTPQVGGLGAFPKHKDVLLTTFGLFC